MDARCHKNAASRIIFLCGRKALKTGGNSVPFLEELQDYQSLRVLSDGNLLQGILACTSLLAKQGM
jgi:hypothetical protein